MQHQQQQPNIMYQRNDGDHIDPRQNQQPQHHIHTQTQYHQQAQQPQQYPQPYQSISHSFHNTQLPQLNRTQSTSSSYTSTTSPSNFTSFSYNSPSVNPPSHISLIQRNSLSSRSGSIDNLSNSVSSSTINGIPINSTNSSNPNASSLLTGTSFGNNHTHSYNNPISFTQNFSSSLTPAGRRSLLTSKLQQHAQQQQQSLSQTPQFERPHENFLRRTSNNSINSNGYMPLTQASSSYSTRMNFMNSSQHNQYQQPQQPQQQPQQLLQEQQQHIQEQQPQLTNLQNDRDFFHPTPASATTDVSKDIAFSTNSSSSTLYKDAQSNINMMTEETPIRGSEFNTAPGTSIHNNFISVSAPAPVPPQFTQAAKVKLPLPADLQQQRQIQPQSDPNIQTQFNTGEHLNIADFDPQELFIMLSALLQKIVEANDLLHNSDHPPNQHRQSISVDDGTGLLNSKYSANILAFHGKNIPSISLYSYLTRILKYCPVTNDVFISLLVYFDRIAKRANNCEKTSEDAIMNGDDTSESNEIPQVFVMDSYNIHRLIISGITVASKFFSDVFYKNSRYAKVGGLPLEELNHLELQFLLLLDFQLMIQVEELEKYGDLLLKFWQREQTKSQEQTHQPLQPQELQQPQQQQPQDQYYSSDALTE